MARHTSVSELVLMNTEDYQIRIEFSKKRHLSLTCSSDIDQEYSWKSSWLNAIILIPDGSRSKTLIKYRLAPECSNFISFCNSSGFSISASTANVYIYLKIWESMSEGMRNLNRLIIHKDIKSSLSQANLSHFCPFGYEGPPTILLSEIIWGWFDSLKCSSMTSCCEMNLSTFGCHITSSRWRLMMRRMKKCKKQKAIKK